MMLLVLLDTIRKSESQDDLEAGAWPDPWLVQDLHRGGCSEEPFQIAVSLFFRWCKLCATRELEAHVSRF